MFPNFAHFLFAMFPKPNPRLSRLGNAHLQHLKSKQLNVLLYLSVFRSGMTPIFEFFHPSVCQLVPVSVPSFNTPLRLV